MIERKLTLVIWDVGAYRSSIHIADGDFGAHTRGGVTLCGEQIPSNGRVAQGGHGRSACRKCARAAAKWLMQ